MHSIFPLGKWFHEFHVKNVASKIIVVCEKIFWGNKCFHMFSHTMVSYLVNGSSVSLINEFDWKYQWQFLLSYWIITRVRYLYCAVEICLNNHLFLLHFSCSSSKNWSSQWTTDCNGRWNCLTWMSHQQR